MALGGAPVTSVPKSTPPYSRLHFANSKKEQDDLYG